MAKRSFLLRRGNVFYFRRKYPDDVRHKFKNPEFKVSLKTGDLKAVEGPYAEALQLFLQKVERARCNSRKRAISLNIAAPTGHERPMSELDPNTMRELVGRWFIYEQLSEPPSLDEDEIKALQEEWAHYANGNFEELYPIIHPIVANLVTRSGYRLDATHPNYSILSSMIARGIAANLERQIAISQGHADQRPTDELFASFVRSGLTAGTSAAPTRRRTLDVLIDDYIKDRSALDLAVKTRMDEKVYIDLFKEIFGPATPVSDVNYEACVRAREIIRGLPPHYRKIYPTVSLARIPEQAKRDGHAPISTKTANKYLNFLSSLFSYAVRTNVVSVNPAKNLAVRLRKTANRTRKPFTPEHLRIIFSAPLYRGCKDGGLGYAQPGTTIPRDTAKYWVPLIALYSGMRLNEICQLDTADILKVSNVDLFNISEDGPLKDKSVKTDAGSRVVPIHPELKRLGFMKFVAQRRSENSIKLFPELRPGKASGLYSDPFSKRFGNFLKSVGINDEGTCFHSFRHLFRDRTRAAKIDREYVNAIFGWSRSESMADHYGSDALPGVLLRQISKVKFENLDLSSLYCD